MTSRRTPLNVIEVKGCPADWNAMRGDDRQRFCAGCQKTVHNLSAMPRDEAERLVCDSAGSLCVRFTRDASGDVRTLEYSRPVKGFRGWRFWSVIGAAGAMLAALASVTILGRRTTVTQGDMGGGPPTTSPTAGTNDPMIMMGGICAPPPLPATTTQPHTQPTEADVPGRYRTSPEAEDAS